MTRIINGNSPSSVWRRANPERWEMHLKTMAKAARAKRSTVDGRIDTCYNNMVTRNQTKGRGLKLTKTYLRKLVEESGMKCQVSGVQLTAEAHNLNVFSFDRIDNNKGYVYGNLQVVSATVNYAKRTMTNEQLFELSKSIVQHNNLTV